MLAHHRRLAIRTAAAVLLLAAVSLLPAGSWGTSPSSPVGPTSASGGPLPPVAPATGNNTTLLGCDGVYWASDVWANYSPSWCYGHDEATMSFISNAPGSGEDANYSFSLPADTAAYPQADFYATFWLGAVVYDPASLDSQAYLEFQFYPAPPGATGPGSGAEDCLPGGVFSYSFDPGSNDWFACAVVWQIVGTSENAAFSGPLNVQGTTSIFEIHSNDQIYVNDTGVAQNTSQPWQLDVTDSTTHTSGSVSLRNGTTVLSPYYSIAALGNHLIWGADIPGAFAVAYEIGHSLNPAIPETGYYGACYPGDLECDSYWPGLWGDTGQMQLSLPAMGSAGNQTYPYDIALGSSVQGEAWINGTIAHDESTCGHPSWSPATNCLYPWYIYRSQNYSFTFDANNETNDTHDYGNWYQFPATGGTVRYLAAPWGTLDSSVIPTTAQVEFNPIARTHAVPVQPNGAFDEQFMEGAYWLNVSAPGCTTSSNDVYLGQGEVYDTPVTLDCVGYYPVVFNETGLPSGTTWSVTLAQSSLLTTGASLTFYAQNGTESFSVLSPVLVAPGVRSVATPNNGTVHVRGAPLNESIDYATQYEFTAVASPASAAAVINPVLGWSPPGTVLSVTALPGPSWVFEAWTGIGTGSYTGSADPASVVMNGPIQEAAFFSFVYTVSFTETGLPSNALWGVDLNGVFRANSTATISFQMMNGSYTYNISGPSGYTISSTTGSGRVHGSDVAVAVQFTAILLFGLTGLDLEVILLIVVAVAVAVGTNVVFWWMRRKRPPPSQASPAKNPPPPWLGGPPSG